MQLLMRREQKWLSKVSISTYFTSSSSQSKISRQTSSDLGATLTILQILAAQSGMPQAKQESVSATFLSIYLTSDSFFLFHSLYRSILCSIGTESNSASSEKQCMPRRSGFISLMKFRSASFSDYSTAFQRADFYLKALQAYFISGSDSNSSFRQRSCHFSSSLISFLSLKRKSRTLSVKSVKSTVCYEIGVRDKQDLSMALMALTYLIQGLLRQYLMGTLCFLLLRTTQSYLDFYFVVLKLTKGQKNKLVIVSQNFTLRGSRLVYFATILELCLAILLVTRYLLLSPSLMLTTLLREQLSIWTVYYLQFTTLPGFMWSSSPKSYRSY